MRLALVPLLALLAASVACDGGSADDPGPVSETIEEIDEAAGVDTLKPDDGPGDPDGAGRGTPPAAE